VIGKIIGGVIVILVGILLFPLVLDISNEVGGVNDSLVAHFNLEDNSTGGLEINDLVWGTKVLKLVPFFFALGLLSVVLSILYQAFRKSGLITDDEEEGEEDDDYEKEEESDYSRMIKKGAMIPLHYKDKEMKEKECIKKLPPIKKITEEEINRSEFD